MIVDREIGGGVSHWGVRVAEQEIGEQGIG